MHSQQPSMGVSVAGTWTAKAKPSANFIDKFHPVKNLTLSQKFSVKIPKSREKITAKQTRKQPLHEIIFKPLDALIHRFFINASPLPTFIDPKHTLRDNFSPVDELPPTSCHVAVGPLPACLDGAYIQNGPNPQFTPRGAHHFADGDGMLHSLKISNGQATFCSRFVQTHRYTVERALGYPIFPSFVALLNQTALTPSTWLTVLRMISFQFSPLVNGIGAANTSLVLFAGKLLAMIEYDLPYQIKMTEDGDLVTLGRHDFHSGSKLFINMTAHPKIDADTGEAFAFSFNVVPPFLTFFRIGSDGKKQKNVPIFSTKGPPSFIHDFAVTKRFAIFPDTQVLIDPLAVLRGKTIMRADPDKVQRLGIIPRYAMDESEMYWIDAPGLNMLHAFNAWEEDDGDTIVIVASNVLSVENMLEGTDSRHVSLEKIVIDVRARKVLVRRALSDRNLDFGAINPTYAGKKNRYVYAAVTDEGYPKMIGVVKLDLSRSDDDVWAGDCAVASRMYEKGCYGSEPTFVSRDADNPMVEEDDGYLLSYLYNENTKESQFLVMDAKSPSLETVAVVSLPQRLPHGFHTIFVKQSDLPLI